MSLLEHFLINQLKLQLENIKLHNLTLEQAAQNLHNSLTSANFFAAQQKPQIVQQSPPQSNHPAKSAKSAKNKQENDQAQLAIFIEEQQRYQCYICATLISRYDDVQKHHNKYHNRIPTKKNKIQK